MLREQIPHQPPALRPGPGRRRPAPPPTPELALRLSSLEALVDDLERVHNVLALGVLHARAAGATWDALAAALGTHRRTVWGRYADSPLPGDPAFSGPPRMPRCAP